MSESVRVLWLVKGLGLGGAERIVAMSAPALKRAGCEVDVGYLLAEAYHWRSALLEAGVGVYCLGSTGVARHLWPWRLHRLLAAENYDVVHTHSPLAGAVARMVPGGRNSVFVHTEHNVWGSYRSLTRIANALTVGRNSRVFAVSAGVADSLRLPRWAKRVKVPHVEILYHGIEESEVHAGPEARAAGRSRLGFDDAVALLVNVGNLSPKKNQQTLLDAFALVVRRWPDAVLVIIGDGPLRAHLQTYAADLHLMKNVRFVGQRDDVARLLPAFDGFVLSSLHEGLPLALLEAMASGVPVVVTSVGGIPEVISDDENGLMVAPDEPAALATAIASILNDAGVAARLGNAGKATAAKFTISGSVDRTKAVYLALLAGH